MLSSSEPESGWHNLSPTGRIALIASFAAGLALLGWIYITLQYAFF